ncbi:hypothetical protein Tco_0716277 [Tanacetum coccineum]
MTAIHLGMTPMDEDEEDDEEEEQLAPADSAIIVPTIELVSPPEGTEPGSALARQEVNLALFALELQTTRSREVGYGIRDTWVDSAEAIPEIAPMTLGEDAQEGRTRISQRVSIDSQRVDLLMEDKIAHQETIQIVEEEAYASREAWAHAIGLSQAVYSELQTHHEQVYAHESQLHAHQT